MEFDEGRRQFDRAQYHESRNWQDVWHAFSSCMARVKARLGSCFMCGPIKTHLIKEAVRHHPLCLDCMHESCVHQWLVQQHV